MSAHPTPAHFTYLYDHIRTTGSQPPVASRFWYRIPFSPSTVAICLPFAGALKLNDPGMLAGDQETALTPMACAWNFSPSAEPSSVLSVSTGWWQAKPTYS